MKSKRWLDVESRKISGYRYTLCRFGEIMHDSCVHTKVARPKSVLFRSRTGAAYIGYF